MVEGYDYTIYGGPGDDSLSQESGDGNTYGGRGNDPLGGGSGREKLFGRPGNDTLWANDNRRIWEGFPDSSAQEPDYLYCGAGEETVYYDKGLDKVSETCEIKHPVTPTS